MGLLGVPSFSNSLAGQPLPNALFLTATLSVLTFWHNVLMARIGWFNYCLNIYWSLSVEEVFYLTFPIASRLLRRNVLIVGLCCLFILGAPFYRAFYRDDEVLFECGYLACFVLKGTMPYAYKLPVFALFTVMAVLLAVAVARWFAEPANAFLRRRLVARRPAQA